MFTPQEGKAITKLYLEAAGQTLPGDDPSGDGRTVNGVDIIRCDDRGRIVESRVMIRPLRP